MRPWLRARAVALCSGKTERLGAFPFGGAHLIVGVPVPGFVAAAALVRRLAFVFVPLPVRVFRLICASAIFVPVTAVLRVAALLTGSTLGRRRRAPAPARRIRWLLARSRSRSGRGWTARRPLRAKQPALRRPCCSPWTRAPPAPARPGPA